jgi:4-hydroxy-3-methylbut-2-en-1-yl diphosphate reductase
VTICTPLRSEWLAVRDRLAEPPVRTGRGPSGRLPYSAGPVLVAGVAGALVDGIEPGDLVVASAVEGGGDRVTSSAAPLLAGALRRAGLTVHVGDIASTDRVIDDSATRGRLAATGAIAVDSESAFLARSAPDGRVAVVRAIVDTPSRPLLRPGIVWRGIEGLRSLRRAAPVLQSWANAAGDREIRLAAPRSFCAGVERAIEIVERALDRYGPPVYVRRQIVHNLHVVRDLEARGAVFVDEVEQVPAGSVLVFAAHGVAPDVRQSAADRELQVIDATCPLVTKVHNEVRRFAAREATVFLIGHEEHEEVVGTRGEAPGHIEVIGSMEDAARVTVPDPEMVAYVMQTTLAVDDAERIAAVLRDRFPALSAPRKDDICYATTNRQRSVRAIARMSDLVLVVGSANSSNSLRLVEVAAGEGAEAYLVEDATDVDLDWLAGRTRIGITAGASAPPDLVDELVGCLSGLGATDVLETRVVDERVQFTLPREVL